MIATSAKRIEDIEALRALAIMLTIIGHLEHVFPWPSEFFAKLDRAVALWGGVDLFFAISGFVIARELLTRFEPGSSKIDLWRESFSFWIRRAYRLWPTAWLWPLLLVCFSFTAYSPIPWPAPHRAIGDFAAVVTHVANIHHWMCANNLSNSQCGATVVWWSLSLEEQFYIALPLVLIFVPRKWLPRVLLGAVAVQFFIARPVWSLGWVLRTDAICWGVLLAMFERTPVWSMLRPTFMRSRAIALAVMAVLCFLLVELPSNAPLKNDIVPFATGLIAMIAAILTLIASYNMDVIIGALPARRVMLWIGSRSYALYLIHAFCLQFNRQVWIWIEPKGTVFAPNYTLRFIATYLVFTLLLAELNYRFIETPLRRKGKEIARRFSGKSTNPSPPPEVAEIGS